MDQVKKFIQETVSGILEEDYASIKEIKTLANDILILASQKNLNYILQQINDFAGIRLYPVSLSDVYRQNSNKYPVLGEFLKNSHITVMFRKVKTVNKQADYTVYDEVEYDPTRPRDINLYYTNFSDIINKIQEYEHNKWVIGYQDIYMTLYFMFESPLEHEIQHAYDDYRSKSKIFKTQGQEKFDKKYNGIENPYENTKRHSDYLKLQHEIWARFTQAVNETRFTNLEFYSSKDNLDYIQHYMLPLPEVIQSFIVNFKGWRHMTDAYKKRLIGRVSSYWHQEQTALPEKNAKELSKAEPEHQLAEVRRLVKSSLIHIFE